MAFPVSSSSTALVFDTLPSLKARYWYLPQPAPKLYAMARCYVLNGALRLSLVSFERTPPVGSRLAFAAGGSDGRLLLARMGPQSSALFLCDAADRPGLWADVPGVERPMAQPERIAGVDEQGWYWGVQLTLPAQAVAEAGIRAVPGAAFRGAVFKHDALPGAYGASFRPLMPDILLDPAQFDLFEIVDY